MKNIDTHLGEGWNKNVNILIQKSLTDLVARGLSNKEVVNQLFILEKTVQFHLKNIYKKLNLTSRAQLILYCLSHIIDRDQRL